jgi:hypothetical protein
MNANLIATLKMTAGPPDGKYGKRDARMSLRKSIEKKNLLRNPLRRALKKLHDAIAYLCVMG